MRADFVKLAQLGYSRLVPVIPPDAPLPADAGRELVASRGKMPGHRPLINGRPAPFYCALKGWLHYQLTEHDARWFTESGCNAGLVLGPASGIYCLDLDITDDKVAAAAQHVVTTLCGRAMPFRIGSWPKVAYYFLAPTGPGIRRVRVKFADATGTEHLIELLGEGQQSVIAGEHPKTHAAFAWVIPGRSEMTPIPPAPAELHQLTLTQLHDLPKVIAETLERQCGCRILASEGRLIGGSPKRQDDLLAPSLETLRAAITQLPNPHAHFPRREDYIAIGYAIKAAAGPEHEDEAFSLFLEWCERWDGGTNDYDTVHKDWRGMVGDKRVGWHWLIQRARECGVELAALDFDSKPLPPEHDTLGPPPTNDVMVAYSQGDCAQRVVQEHQWAYCFRSSGQRWPEWMRWNGQRWELDRGSTYVKHAVRTTAERMAMQLMRGEPNTTGLNRARGLASMPFQNGVLTMLSSYLELNGTAVQFDANPWLLNTPSGIINIATGQLGPHDAKQFCMSMANITPKLNPSLDEWSYTRAWFKEVTCNDGELEHFLYQLAALALTGYTGIQRWFVLLGGGGNGKSTLLNLLLKMMGGYAASTSAEVFQVQRGGKDYGLSRFKSKRLVVATEATGQAVWNTSLLAALTGGDEIEAEEKFKQPELFRPQSKIVIASNNMPKLRTIDAALSRRFTAVPFNRSFEAENDTVPRRLEAEAPAFLGHLIQEAVALCKRVAQGLPAAQVLHLPLSVRDTSREQIGMQDLLTEWMMMRLVSNPSVATPVRLLYEDFARCMLDKHDRDWPIRVFSQELAKRGHHPQRRGVQKLTVIDGLGFRPDAWDSPVADALAGFEAADAAARSNVISLQTRQAIQPGAAGTLGPDVGQQLGE